MKTALLKRIPIVIGILIPFAIQAQTTQSNQSSTDLKPQIIEVAKPISLKGLISNDKKTPQQLSKFQLVNKKRIHIRRPGASFLKLHFNRLILPAGTHIEVKNADGTQVHRYGNDAPSLKTLRDGDDGQTSFYALTIFGEEAIVEVIGQTALAKTYHVEIDSVMEGFPENDIEEAFMNQSSPIDPMSTCGVNERKDVQCWADSHPTEFERSRPVARLLINGSGSCTAWRVGPDNRMFTNNHCMETANGIRNTEVWFNYQRSGCGSGSTPGRVIVRGEDLLSTNEGLDYTLFSVKNFDQIQQFGHFGLDVREPIAQERIYIPQHGRGQPKQLSIESDQNSDGLCRVDVTLADGSAPNTDMGYMCDTIGGSSGSPVLAASTNNVLALHHFGGCPNQGVLIHKIWPEVATHFNNQIPVGDNGEPSGDPIANFSYDMTDGVVTFQNLSSDNDGTIVDHQWDFGDGNISTEENPIHAFSSAGDFTVQLTVTDNDGNTNTTSQIITIINDTDGQLTRGVPVTGLSGSRGEEVAFYFDAPADIRSLKFEMSGGSGDADLYVKFNQEPTTRLYDCRPYKSGNKETCSFNTPQEGRYFVMIRAYSSYAGAQLVVNYSEPGNEVSFEETDLSDSRGNWQHFTLEVPENMAQLIGQMSGGSGDADMYVRFGSPATTTSYDCRPYKNGNNESCTFSNPQAGTWYFSVRAYSNYSGVTLYGEAN